MPKRGPTHIREFIHEDSVDMELHTTAAIIIQHHISCNSVLQVRPRVYLFNSYSKTIPEESWVGSLRCRRLRAFLEISVISIMRPGTPLPWHKRNKLGLQRACSRLEKPSMTRTGIRNSFKWEKHARIGCCTLHRDFTFHFPQGSGLAKRGLGCCAEEGSSVGAMRWRGQWMRSVPCRFKIVW